MREKPMLGFIRTISQIKLAHLIKLWDMIMEFPALRKLSAKTVCLIEDAGLRPELKSMEWMNMVLCKENKI